MRVCAPVQMQGKCRAQQPHCGTIKNSAWAFLELKDFNHPPHPRTALFACPRSATGMSNTSTASIDFQWQSPIGHIRTRINSHSALRPTNPHKKSGLACSAAGPEHALEPAENSGSLDQRFSMRNLRNLSRFRNPLHSVWKLAVPHSCSALLSAQPPPSLPHLSQTWHLQPAGISLTRVAPPRLRCRQTTVRLLLPLSFSGGQPMG